MRVTAVALVCALVLTLAVPVLAAETDSYTLWHYGYDAEGHLHEIWYDPISSTPYYYFNGVKQFGCGLIFIKGNYYYVRTQGQVVFNRSYGITYGNGLLPATTYSFDEYGRLVDPRSYPDDWESQWFDSDPTVTVPTEPPVTDPPVTDPPVTEPPVTVPPATDPVPGLDTSADPNGIMGLFGLAVAACSNWFVFLLDGTGFGGVFLAMVFLWLSYKFLLKPVFGSGGSDKAKKKKEDA